MGSFLRTVILQPHLSATVPKDHKTNDVGSGCIMKRQAIDLSVVLSFQARSSQFVTISHHHTAHL